MKNCPCCNANKYIELNDNEVECYYCKSMYKKAELEKVLKVDIKNLFEKTKYAICMIRMMSKEKDPSTGKEKLMGAGSGTGWYIGNNTIITNAHVALFDHQVINSIPYKHISASFPFISEEKSYQLIVEKVNQFDDIAVLKILDDDSQLKKYALKFSSKQKLEVCDYVYTIGNSIGRGLVPCEGMITKTDDNIPFFDSNNNKYPCHDNYRTSLIIYPGNSGGPLFDENGEVVGEMCAALVNGEKDCNSLTLAVKGDNIIDLIKSDDIYKGEVVPYNNITTNQKSEIDPELLKEIELKVLPHNSLNPDLRDSFWDVLVNNQLVDYLNCLMKGNNFEFQFNKNDFSIVKGVFNNGKLGYGYLLPMSDDPMCYGFFIVIKGEDYHFFTINNQGFLEEYTKEYKIIRYENVSEMSMEDVFGLINNKV